MEINITGRNIDLTNEIKTYIGKRLGKIPKLYSRIYRCEVILEEEKNRKLTEVILYLKRNRVVAKESSIDLFASIDLASENVKKQLRRINGRIRSSRRKSVFRNIIRPVMLFSNETDHVKEGQQSIIKSDTFADKPMLPEEAKLELQMLERTFIMFKNADTGEINVIYKRNDGNYGLIEPKF